MQPGVPLLVATDKWGGRPHWEFRAVYLGTDEHGEWLGAPAGTLNARPGRSFVSAVDAVTLVPHQDADERGYLATFYAVGFSCDTYVDITTPARWGTQHGTGQGIPVLRCTDLDLDVVRGLDRQVYVDDEDEFAEHQVALAYPPHVVAAAERSCAAVRASMLAELPPYGAEARPWFESLRALRRRSH